MVAFAPITSLYRDLSAKPEVETNDAARCSTLERPGARMSRRRPMSRRHVLLRRNFETSRWHDGAMKTGAAFGRRGPPVTNPAPCLRAPTLAPDRRALLFGSAAETTSAETTPVSPALAAGGIAPWSRTAAFAASLAVTCIVAAFTLGGDSREPVALAATILSFGANLAANLWMTQKFCALARLPGFVAFALTGALLGLGVSFVTARLGLGETAPDDAIDALAGASAALLYRLLAGRNTQTRKS
jgi:hypothetical protein